MRNYDTIDIFFIALISGYFITLLCIIISLLYIFLTKHLFKKEVKEQNIEVKEKKKTKKEFSLKKWLYNNTLFQKLFMVEVKKDKTKEKDTKKKGKNSTAKKDAVKKKTTNNKKKKTGKKKSNSSKKKSNNKNKKKNYRKK